FPSARSSGGRGQPAGQGDRPQCRGSPQADVGLEDQPGAGPELEEVMGCGGHAGPGVERSIGRAHGIEPYLLRFVGTLAGYRQPGPPPALETTVSWNERSYRR